MSTDVIGSRYRLGGVVTCTPESTTWRARDTWLDARVLVVTPEPGFDARFTALASALMDRSSAHFLGLYDIGTLPSDFVVFGVPSATLSDEHIPREEEDVLVAGRALGDALGALHERGIVHGDLHPGSVALAESGDAALSPWPLSPRPADWSGPGGFGSDPHERRHLSAHDDLRALGAVLLGALAGPPVLSSEQIGNLERELADRAPDVVTIADRALTPPNEGGYGNAVQLRDDCAAALSGHLAETAVTLPEPAREAPFASVAASGRPPRAAAGRPEGHRAALVVAATGAAVLAGLWASGSVGARPNVAGHPAAVHPPMCGTRPGPRSCAPSDLPLAATPPQDRSGHSGPPPAPALAESSHHREASGSSVDRGTAGSTGTNPEQPSSSGASGSTSNSTTTTSGSSTSTTSDPTTTSSTTTSSTTPSSTSTTSTTSTTASSVPSSPTTSWGSGSSQAAANGSGGFSYSTGRGQGR